MFEFENYAWISRKCVRKRENTAQKLKAVVRKELISSQHKFSFITNLAQASSLYDNDGGADPRHVFLAIRSKIFGFGVFCNKNVFAPKKIIITKIVETHEFSVFMPEKLRKTFARQKLMGKQNRQNA